MPLLWGLNLLSSIYITNASLMGRTVVTYIQFMGLFYGQSVIKAIKGYIFPNTIYISLVISVLVLMV